MTEYDNITAYHYVSYRPDLHGLILERSLGDEFFTAGLDIGCGTGQSSIALASFCDKVVGIDPSQAMISKGIAHTKVSYKRLHKTHFDFKDDSFDVITLAGSLWYAKSQELLDEISRVGKSNSTVFVYDFEILLETILDQIGFKSSQDATDSYNHQEDFSGLDISKISKIEKKAKKIQIQVLPENVAHLILSVKEQYTFLENAFGSDQLYDKMVKKLNELADTNTFTIHANTFFTLYRVK